MNGLSRLALSIKLSQDRGPVDKEKERVRKEIKGTTTLKGIRQRPVIPNMMSESVGLNKKLKESSTKTHSLARKVTVQGV